jgi:hypothetical protein
VAVRVRVRAAAAASWQRCGGSSGNGGRIVTYEHAECEVDSDERESKSNVFLVYTVRKDDGLVGGEWGFFFLVGTQQTANLVSVMPLQ